MDKYALKNHNFIVLFLNIKNIYTFFILFNLFQHLIFGAYYVISLNLVFCILTFKKVLNLICFPWLVKLQDKMKVKYFKRKISFCQGKSLSQPNYLSKLRVLRSSILNKILGYTVDFFLYIKWWFSEVNLQSVFINFILFKKNP